MARSVTWPAKGRSTARNSWTSYTSCVQCPSGLGGMGEMTLADELILVVEDNEKNLKLIRDLLQLRRCCVLEARTAAQSLALAADRSPRLILMDIQLPDMDGVVALRHLKADPRTAAIPVVALTA